MTDLEVSIDTYKRWTVPVLQQYLRCRNLRTSGRKEELVALVYSSALMKIQPVLTEKEEMEMKAKQYVDKLITPEGTVPDPLVDLPATEWTGESEGVSLWPPTMYHDISNFLQNNPHNKSLSDRLMKDYKEGKAYSYLTSGWLKEIQYHGISKSSSYCFLKAYCSPSQRINDVPHTAWVLIEKKSGEVHSAYCTCFAGLGETCNHVAAMLFKIDYAWQWGKNNKSCTSQPCVWNVPGCKKKEVQPKRLSQLKVMKPHYSKAGLGRPINAARRQLYKPLKGTKPTFQKLSNALLPACPDAAVFEYLSHPTTQYDPSEDFNVSCTVSINTTEDTHLPESLTEMAKKCGSVDELKSKLIYTNEEKEKIITETAGQSENAEWFKQREGRITCSRIHQVVTKSKTLEKRTVNTESLICEIMGYKKTPSNIPSLKYGRTMEPVARKKYLSILKQRKHSNVEVKETGLHIDKEKGFLGASPDGITQCSCCGLGLLEIKCPLSIAHTIPSDENLAYLEKDESGVKLKRSHNYYTQVQGQMAICRKQWCDFFVFTKHGYHLERILFDIDFWSEKASYVEEFFHKFIATELVHGEISNKITSQETPCNENAKDVTYTASCSTSTDRSQTTYTAKVTGKRQGRKGKRCRNEPSPLYLCQVCKNVCMEADGLSDDVESDFSVGCDTCRKWFHWGCVGYDGMEQSLGWRCDTCEEEKENNKN